MATLMCIPASVRADGTSLLRRTPWPKTAPHATGLSVSGTALAAPNVQVTLLFAAGYLADPGSPPRGAPV